MKTLLFAPCYLDEGERLQRNLKYLDYYKNLKGILHYDEILLVDNASSQEKLSILEVAFPEVKIIKCKAHLGRPSMNNYGYWFSAFGKAAKYALDNGFEKIVHIDSDTYILKEELVNYINNRKTGWLAFWSEIHQYPESVFQIISGKNNIEDMYEHMTRDFLSYFPYEMAETHVPFTHIEKGFIGDRYPEIGIYKQDPSWHYVAQVPVTMAVKYGI